MEALAPYASWLGGFILQVAQPVLNTATKVAPVAPVAVSSSPVPLPASLGLKLLLEPTTGGVMCRAASNTVATIYPVYASAKAIESKEHQDDVQWLTYWTLYGSLILAEHVADQALGKVPYYYHAKLAALLWLQLPQTRGASYLYNRFYKPLLIKFGPRIDAVLQKVQSVLVKLYDIYKVPIEAALAVAVQVRNQLAAAVTWLLSEEKKDKEGAKPNAA